MRKKALLGLWGLQIAVVVVLSLAPGQLIPQPPVRGEVEHALAYLTLGLTPALALGRRGVLKTALLVTVLGATLEVLQLRIPGRAFEWKDITANSLGVLAGASLGLSLRHRGHREFEAGD